MLFKKATIKEVSLDELLEEVWKTLEKSDSISGKVLIKADPRKIEEQRRDMKIIEELIDKVKDAEERSDVFVRAAITVGYANAMEVHGTITEMELKRLNALIGTIAERRLARLTDWSERSSLIACYASERWEHENIQENICR